ncbi:MAG TPA: hypothetical protein VN903_30595 [Polyangia bacterium]|jgi:hypothetical protein|nr:hypothetical protein [Polyangia bacterium]
MGRLRTGVAYLVFAFLGFASPACRESPAGKCVIDLDCPAPAVCEMGACVVPSATGCSKDTDCKGDRICVAGVCTDPPPGSSADASTPATTDAGTAPDAGGAEALVKFCHHLQVDGADVTLTMTAAGKLFPALTYECSSCQTLPANQLLDFHIFHPSGESLLDFQLALEPGDWVFLGTFQNSEPTLRYGKVVAPATCQSVDPFSSLPP